MKLYGLVVIEYPDVGDIKDMGAKISCGQILRKVETSAHIAVARPNGAPVVTGSDSSDNGAKRSVMHAIKNLAPEKEPRVRGRDLRGVRRRWDKIGKLRLICKDRKNIDTEDLLPEWASQEIRATWWCR